MVYSSIEQFEDIDSTFQHPDCEQGYPIEVRRSSRASERGKGHHWFYKIRFAAVDIVTFPQKCTGVATNLPENVKKYAISLPVQPFTRPLKSEDKRDEIIEDIKIKLDSQSGNLDIQYFYP